MFPHVGDSSILYKEGNCSFPTELTTGALLSTYDVPGTLHEHYTESKTDETCPLLWCLRSGAADRQLAKKQMSV